MSSTWSSLRLGDTFTVKSLRGNLYEGTFLARGSGDAGIYARLASGKLGRIHAAMVDEKTLSVGLSVDVFFPDDEVLLTPVGGVELRARVVDSSLDRLNVRVPGGRVLSVPFDQMVKDQLRLMFAPTDWRSGDEFLVRSVSGREYRGRATLVTPDRVEASLTARGGIACRDSVTLRGNQLELKSLRVLVPIRTATLAPA